MFIFPHYIDMIIYNPKSTLKLNEIGITNCFLIAISTVQVLMCVWCIQKTSMAGSLDVKVALYLCIILKYKKKRFTFKKKPLLILETFI